MVSRPLGRLGTVAVVGEGDAAQTPKLDARRLLQDDAGGQALDLGQEGLDAAAAVGAGQVETAQGGQEPLQIGSGGTGVGGGGCHLETPRKWLPARGWLNTGGGAEARVCSGFVLDCAQPRE